LQNDRTAKGRETLPLRECLTFSLVLDNAVPGEEAVVELLPQIVADQTEVVLFGGGEGLAPLRLAHLTPGEALPFHIFTAADGVPGEFVLTWRRGRALPAKAHEMVWGYFAVAEAGEVLNYLLSRVEEAWEETPEDLQFLADTLLVWTQHFFCHEASRTPASLAGSRGLIAALAQGLGSSDNVLDVASKLRRHDSGIFSHCLNVCLLTLAFSPILEWKGEEWETLALGTLLHDLGMMPWALETYRQTAPLTDEEWDLIKTHPDRGAELLKPFADIPEEVVLMVRQHHESANGSGYPLGLQGDEIHPWAKVLKMLDSYEAMTSLRPWRPPIGERQALRIMTSVWSTQSSYDQDFLKRFLAFCQEKKGIE
jgi:HD-GYP domain-containing protein (c-di-GMP phosphodiesterase class II)